MKLEDIQEGSHLSGVISTDIVRVVNVKRVGEHSCIIIYKTSKGNLGEQQLFKSDEERLSLATQGRPWAFDADGAGFKIGIEAYRINQASLFDPMMAVHTSNVTPLPHQISAVYESMLPRQPLRFVLADDPGAGKTIMAGLLIRELLMRADARRILVVAPGSLTDQWQDELFEKFGVLFEIFSREKQEQCVTGNYFDEQDLLICRLDQLSRSEELQEKLKVTMWDLVIVDEAHKLSASYYGSKINKTRRFTLGELLGKISRHFLLMTATPHNGKEEDFQIWLSLLDGDRFYGKFREGAHKVDVSDMMRRMVKEELLKFDGTPLFPERRAYTANYQLSEHEASLYEQVTTYVREEMNRADQLDGKKRSTIGFALTQLQRRLASSPEAIYQSLKRRRRRLEDRLAETKLIARGQSIAHTLPETLQSMWETLSVSEDYDQLDEDMNAEDFEHFTEQVVDQASASETIPELEAEIFSLSHLEALAKTLVESGNDKKWEELSNLLQDKPEMYTQGGHRRKLLIFTEHKDTLNYLVARIQNMLGDTNAVRAIYGGTNRDARRKIQEEFRNDAEVLVLVATDAAGEGVNLQNANLMVNYDLPWNPNRLEQRFGRIHRIGQTEVCHLWNIVANETREGAVFQKLFEKIEVERSALGGKVFDVLGEAFDNVSLKDLLVEAIRYGESAEVREKMSQAIEGALDTEHLKEIMKRNALVDQHMSLEALYSVKEEMDKAEARRLQPYFVRDFFIEAFESLGGDLRSREAHRFEIRHVPAEIRERDRVIGESRTPVLRAYERITFEKEYVRVSGKPMADLMHPAHPLMHSVIDLMLERHRSKLKQGAILVDPTDDGLTPHVLLMVEHAVREEVPNAEDVQRVISRRLQFVYLNERGEALNAGWAPHLDLQPISAEDRLLVNDLMSAAWLSSSLEELALAYASDKLVPDHYQEVKARRTQQADKTLEAVHSRLHKEINYWSDRYIKLKEDVQAGKSPRITPDRAKRTVDELTARLEQRKAELNAMKSIVSGAPTIIGGALVIPAGLLATRKGEAQFTVDAEARKRVEMVAMRAVIDSEEALGNTIFDVSAEKCGWDLTSRLPPRADGSILPDRHIEVKGRTVGQSTITVTRNEIIYGLNQADKFILAIVLVDGESYTGPYYVRAPFTQEPAFGVTSVNYDLNELLSQAVSPNEV